MTLGLQEEDFLTYMFGFQDSQGLEDVPKAVATIVGAEEQLSAVNRGFRLGGTEAGIAAALLCRLRFRRNLLNVRFFYMRLGNLF